MDFSEIRKKTGIVEEDIAKRLQDEMRRLWGDDMLKGVLGDI